MRNLEPSRTGAARRQLRALVAEDDTADFQILEYELRRSGFDPECIRVDTEAAFAAELRPGIDVILSDYSLPGWDAFRGLELLQATGLKIPFVVVSGALSDELALECMRCGAADYLLKDRLARLGQAVARAVDDAAARLRAESVQQTEQELKRLEAIFESMTEGIIIVDPQGTILSANPAALRLYGFSSVAEVRSAFSDIGEALVVRDVSGRLLPLDEYPLRRALRGETVSNLELQGRANVTGKTWVGSYNTTHVRDTSGNVILIVITIRDITEQKRLEAEKRAHEERLREVQKMETIGILAGGVAHDFNNLLVGILGNASLALETLPQGSEAAGLLDHVIKSGEHAADLTRQLLAYAGKGRFVLERLDFAAVVRDAVQLVRPSIGKKIDVQLDLPTGLPALEADAAQLRQIVTNLVLNAAEAIGSSAGNIRAAVREQESAVARHDFAVGALTPGRYIVLEVEDTGCGMDETTRARIFDPFFSTKFAGRGLGLAAVSGIVRAQKGAIRVRSTPGRGTGFELWFPVPPRAGAAEPAQAPARAVTPGECHGTILVIDDEQLVLQVAKLGLERHGYEVLSACSAAEAVEILRGHRGRVTLAILDLSMPGAGGEEVLPRLLEVQPDLDVIVSSGYAEQQTMRRFAGTRVCGFLQKPYTGQQLVARVNALTRGRTNRRQ